MSKKIKSLIISIIAIIVFVLTYFFLPRNIVESNVSAGKEKVFEESLTRGIYSSSSQKMDLDNNDNGTVDIAYKNAGIVASDAELLDEGEEGGIDNSVLLKEHRGFCIMTSKVANPTIVSYEEATAYKTTINYNGKSIENDYRGIKNRTVLEYIVNEQLNNYDSEYAWHFSLKHNTSLFCLQKGQPLPQKGFANLGPILVRNSQNNNINVNNKDNEIIKAILNEDGIIDVGAQIDGIGSDSSKIGTDDGTQYTRVDANFSISSESTGDDGDALSTTEAYIFSYSERKNYQEDQAQIALWLSTGATQAKIESGSATTNEHYKKGYKLYHEAEAVASLVDGMITPTISAVENETGTRIEQMTVGTENGKFYKIGPFTMNDYTYGWSTPGEWDFSDESVTGELLAGIVEAELKLDNGEDPIKLGKDNFIFERTSTDEKAICDGQHVEIDEIKQDCTVKLWEAPSAEQYIYPTPGSEFYIVLPYDADYLIDASKITDINMIYKYTTAEGKGWKITGSFANLTWKAIKDEENKVKWEVIERTTCDTQEMRAVQYARVCDKYEKCSIGNIPLVAKVEINKYIANVKHRKDYISSDIVSADLPLKTDGTYTRASLTETEKQANPVYVEYADGIIYNIDITNYSAFGIKVNIEDIIPSEESGYCRLVSFTNQAEGETITDLKEKFVEIDANTTGTIQVGIQVLKRDGEGYVNLAKMLTTNNGIVDCIKTKDDNGPVILNSSIKIEADGSGKAKLPSKGDLKLESKDYYSLNDYNVSVNKYISGYESSVMNDNNTNGLTNETVSLGDRANMTDAAKEANPVQVEKGDKITYTIKVKNDAVDEQTDKIASGVKKATVVCPNRVTEQLPTGLKYISVRAVVFNEDNTENRTLTQKEDVYQLTQSPEEFSCTAGANNRFELHTNAILKPGEYIKYFVTVEVEENNMYLGTLENSAVINKLKNRNNGHVKDVNTECGCGNPDRNKSTAQATSKEYVKMKDLVIAGKVWFDEDQDGLMKAGEDRLENIIVKLYRVGTTDPIRTTKTDSNGLYTFAKDENGTFYTSNNTVSGSNQRIPKATGSTYNKYYIEYEYDGLKYNSTQYAGISNLGANGEISDKYKIDSNASELESTRTIFDGQYEIITYNKAYKTNGNSLGESIDLSYTKNGHTSELNPGTLTTGTELSGERIMTARSFINVDKNDSYLWLYNQTEDYTVPDTEYLKYINLGLVDRNKFDLSLTQDVYEVKTTINGDQMTYEYNQDNTETYMKDYVDDSSTLKPYIFRIYNSDYYYKVDQYNIASVEAYKGTESELNVETTYKIRVTNNTTDAGVYAGINEIVEYYDNNFVSFGLNSDGTVKTFNIKTKDENGYLVNTPVKVVSAKYVNSAGEKICDAILSTTSLYNNANHVNGYNDYPLYIRPQAGVGAGEIILAKGESVDILITFVCAKEPGTRNIILDDKINVAEINAYSTYYKDESNIYQPAGLVDCDSNPGNFGESGDVLETYEDDTFKTGITINCNTVEEDKERTLTGFVWDDARTNTVTDNNGVQYVGDGIYNTISAIADAKKNEKVSNKEEKDIAIKDMKVQLVEMIAVPEYDGTRLVGEKVYEEVISVHPTISKMEVRTNSAGEYKLTGYIPGNYIVKFYYGDDESHENMLIFNGQDYKSTTYQATATEYAENKDNPDEVLAVLEKEAISDAKDDEIRRLETISYSETITNNINTILRGQDSTNKTALVGNTKMESETAEFYVKTEKVASTNTKLSYAATMAKLESTTPRHRIQNIDFGIEYRPELQVSLDKYISNVKITTSDSDTTSTPLVNAKFEEYYGIVTKTETVSGKTEFLTDANGEVIKVDKAATNAEIESAVNAASADISKCQKTDNGLYVVTIAGTKLDTENSVGLANLQYVENIDDTQGFVYLNIDDEIMQGASISIEYLMVASNLSEIDRVSSNLSNLRVKENEAVRAYTVNDKYYDQVSFQLGEHTGYIDLDYSGAQTARNKLFSEYYEYELNPDNTIKKDDNGNDIIYRIKSKDIEVDSNKKVKDTGYYGRYLGSLYYTGVIGDKDVVAELKIDKILDYIDNDLVFNESENNGQNGRWKATTSQELYDSNLVSSLSFIGGAALEDEALVGAVDNKQLIDNKNRAFDTSQRSNLAILLDDPTINENISKYLTPRYSNNENSYGTVNLVASKVISAEEESEDMTYDNIAEIVQYSSVTGRVTSLATTLGNATFFDEDDNPVSEWDASTTESDTSATEKVTLTPPTGLGRAQQIVRNTVEGVSYTLLIVCAVTIVCVGVLVGIRLYRKRPIK